MHSAQRSSLPKFTIGRTTGRDFGSMTSFPIPASVMSCHHREQHTRTVEMCAECMDGADDLT